MAGYVVIVDDNEDDREVLESAFPTGRLRTCEAYESRRAFNDGFLAGLRGKNFDTVPALFVIDVRLEKLDSGLEILRDIKRRPKLRRVPVVIVSGANEDADIAEAYQRGATVYIVKQDDEEKTIRALKKAVAGMLAGRIPDDISEYLNDRM